MGAGDWPGVVRRGFVFDDAPFASCHAATLVEADDGGIVASFFAGSREGAPDVAVWSARYVDGRWEDLVRVADGIQADGTPLPCWNPVLFRMSGTAGELWLFYKVGPSPSRWWGMVSRSFDNGRTWSRGERLPGGILGPAKNKPVELPGGRVVSPCSVELPNEGRWRVYFELSDDAGRTWHATEPVSQPSEIPRAVQPTLLVHGPQTLQALCRTTVGRLCESWSTDGGMHWSPLQLTDLPNCNSGVDGVTLAARTEGGARHLLVYNHSNLEKVRYPLTVAATADGIAWQAAAVLENEPPGQYSYPAVIQSRDARVHVAYTWKRRKIAHVILDPERLTLRSMDSFRCPPPGSATHRSDEFQ